MNIVKTLKQKVYAGETIDKEDALALYDAALTTLCDGADAIRRHFCGNRFDLCTIINAKNGRCSENCKYCGQSSFYHTAIQTYDLLPAEKIAATAKNCDARGALRFSIVTSGKALSDAEVDDVCKSVVAIRKETSISICASLGLLNESQFKKLKDAGVTRIHNNLETSRRNFPNVCTSHRFDDKVAALHRAGRCGLDLCSGIIIGLGETIEDRIDLALTLQSLGVKSVPVNILDPIPGTPYENNAPLTLDEIRRTVAVYRFLLPDAAIRLAGGRRVLPDQGRSCFLSGANAAISGNMLTTTGTTLENDVAILKDLGYEAVMI